MSDSATETSAASPEVVRFEARGRVAVITLDRPAQRNAVNGALAAGLEAAVDRLEEDDALWLGVIVGNGRVFCAGADLKAVAAGEGNTLGTERGGFAGFVARERTKPIIAACDGPALAGGCEIALACDLIVASTESYFAVPEVKRSLAAAAGGLFRLPQVLPRNVATEMILTGDPVPAERAHALGMVNRLCEPGDALDTALGLAEQIAVNAPLAVRESLAVTKEAKGLDDAAAFDRSNEAMRRLARTDDFAEGPRAFIEKRAPEWKGR
ncbi:MAG: crotonase/enoyl-CoA hydratase family protein [Acidimicrobiales bacterium]